MSVYLSDQSLCLACHDDPCTCETEPIFGLTYSAGCEKCTDQEGAQDDVR